MVFIVAIFVNWHGFRVIITYVIISLHDDVIKWKHIPRYWSFVWGIHRSPVNSTHKDQWRGALVFSLICTWINGWVNNHEAGDLRRSGAHYDVTVMDLVVWHSKLWVEFMEQISSATMGNYHTWMCDSYRGEARGPCVNATQAVIPCLLFT